MEPGHVAGLTRARDPQVRMTLDVQVERDEPAETLELGGDDAVAEPRVPVPSGQVEVDTRVLVVVGHVQVVVVEPRERRQRIDAEPRQELLADLGDDLGILQVDDDPAAFDEVFGGGHRRGRVPPGAKPDVT